MTALHHRKSGTGHRRSGVAAVECAIVMPILILLTIAAVDVGRFINVSQVVDNASRVGVRTASKGTVVKLSDIETVVMSYLGNSFPGVPPEELRSSTTIRVSDSSGNAITNSDLARVGSGSPVAVEVGFEYDSVRWMGDISVMSGNVLRTRSVMRRE